MTRRAAFSQAEINRALKAAKAHGYRVAIEGDRMEFLPGEGGAGLPSADSDKAWDKALSKWRRSA